VDSKKFAILFGAVFVLVGVLGFFPNPLVGPEGIFVVNTAHNLVHLVTGAAFLIGAYTGGGANAQLITKIIGAAYALVAVLGFFSGEMLLGMIHVNEADRWLHVALALAILAAGFGLKGGSKTAKG